MFSLCYYLQLVHYRNLKSDIGTDEVIKCGNVHMLTESGKKKGKVNPCTGTEALYRPYGP